jgi:hypothetical protein
MRREEEGRERRRRLTHPKQHTNISSSLRRSWPESSERGPGAEDSRTCGRKNKGPAMAAIKLLGIKLHKTRPPAI